jgi:hypothetical protein
MRAALLRRALPRSAAARAATGAALPLRVLLARVAR